MSQLPYTAIASPLRHLDDRRLLPLVGQANAPLARLDNLLHRRRQGTLKCLRGAATSIRLFVEHPIHSGLHKTICGVYRLHKCFRGHEHSAAVSA
jgi:hypothetical protein